MVGHGGPWWAMWHVLFFFCCVASCDVAWPQAVVGAASWGDPEMLEVFKFPMHFLHSTRFANLFCHVLPSF